MISTNLQILWTRHEWIKNLGFFSSRGLLAPNRYLLDLSNELLNIDFGERAAKLSEVKVGGWKKICQFSVRRILRRLQSFFTSNFEKVSKYPYFTSYRGKRLERYDHYCNHRMTTQGMELVAAGGWSKNAKGRLLSLFQYTVGVQSPAPLGCPFACSFS